MRLHQQECQFDGDAWHRIEHLINPNSLPNKSALSHSAVIVRDSPTVDDLVKLCATHDTLADFPPSTTAHNLFCGLPPVAIIHSLISIFRNPRQHRNLITSQLLLSLSLSHSVRLSTMTRLEKKFKLPRSFASCINSSVCWLRNGSHHSVPLAL